MPTADIGSETYSVYADQEFADAYLGADVKRADVWAARSNTLKGRGLVSATRLLQRQSWVSGTAPLILAPSDPDYSLPVSQATAMLAADILSDPELTNSGSTESNIKKVDADGTSVEFFRGTSGTPLPPGPWDLLRGLLGSAVSLGGGYLSGGDFPSRFDDTDYRITGP